MSTPPQAPPAAPPDFSDGEYDARRAALLAEMDAHGVDTLVAYGANRTGAAVTWLTGWPVTREAVAVLHRDGGLELLVGFFNHVPNARRLAGGRATVGWCGDRTADTLAERLRRHGTVAVGSVGPLPATLAAAIDAVADRCVPLDGAHTRLRQAKSPEELDHLRHAAALTDASARALVAAAVPGTSELELVAAVEGAYAGTGATNHVHYVASTPMSAPDRCAPAQWPTSRRLAPGDAVVFELSTAWGQDYPGQVLRTVSVAAELSPLYRDLHAVADEVLARVVPLLRPGVAPAELLEAARVVEEAGFVTVDDLVHGLGGGYLPPVLSSRGAPAGLDAEPLRSGMTLVVQPNVCTPDLSAGVQTGELYLVTHDGPQRLHGLAPGPLPGGRPA